MQVLDPSGLPSNRLEFCPVATLNCAKMSALVEFDKLAENRRFVSARVSGIFEELVELIWVLLEYGPLRMFT